LFVYAAVVDPSYITVPPVFVISPKKSAHYLSHGPATVISHEQIATSGVTTLSQALQSLGSVQLHDTTGNGSQVLLSMRGFGANASSNTLLLVNGIPMTYPDLAPPNLNAVPLHDIEAIEIISGTESVAYGDQAVGGVINIITRQSIKEKIQLSCVGGSYHQHNCYVAWHDRHDPWDFHVTLANLHSENYRHHNDYDENQLSGQLAYLYQKGRIHFYYTIANEDMQYPGALTSQQVKQNRRQATNDTDFFKDTPYFFHLQQQHDFNANWTLYTDLAHRDMHGHGVLFSPFTQARTSTFFKPQLQWKIGQTKVTGGTETQTDHYQLNSVLGFTRDTLQKYSLFAHADVPFASRYTLSLGARGAEQQNHLDSISGSQQMNRAVATTLGIAYQFSAEMNGYLRRAESFRFPKTDELASTSFSVNGLRTQRGVAYEAGININREIYAANFGIYQLDLKDEIAFDPTQTPQNPFGSNRNLAPTMRRGITLSGKNFITKKLTLDGQFNYVDARFQNGVNARHRIPLVSEYILRAGVNYHFAERWGLYPELIYTGNQFAANDDANIAGALGGHTVYNVNLHYGYKQLTASFRINNIFNKYYYFYTVYTPSIPTEFFYPAPGRNATLTVNYAFA
jgi:iron complex outermembrane receptor protein